jgi:hypothetical protein|tara:strand:- start:40 stop:495 length:456 start_codon:yes stop_codon:yes gene_type:complete
MNKLLNYPNKIHWKDYDGLEECPNLNMKWSLELTRVQDLGEDDRFNHFLINKSKPITNYPEVVEDPSGSAIPGDEEERYDDFLNFRPGLRIQEEYFFKNITYYTQSWEIVKHEILDFEKIKKNYVSFFRNIKGFSKEELKKISDLMSKIHD